MSAYTVQRIESPSAEEIDQAVALFVSLMKDGVTTQCLVGGDLSLVDLMARSIRAGCLAGEYYNATTVEDGKMIGFCLWMPPGEDLFNTEEQRALGLTDFMSKLSPEGKEFYKGTYLKVFPSFVGECIGPTGKKDGWWLHMAMTAPEYQRQEVATSLINLVKEKASKHGDVLALAVSAEENVPVYSSMGFQNKGKTTVSSEWGEFPIYVFTYETK
ncbi:hypothetical protein K435DRAFT_723318 [Dendrothele bispora CBS 962.96]|uniref:N-acetyltransferase domain-containing protein n=1 Tax=Dendrothele bispora (strain CBS 962.96) TaxID=1314807 RepID=A0A4S8M2D6_DENBC|nr:hypothetical protein K435DRAFT_723318 [Dendrothele bispora CBS 962.96]